MLQRLRFDDKQAVNYSIIFSVLVCLGIVALGTWLLQYELASVPEGDGFFYDWQLAEPTFWSRATAWIGFAAHQLLIWFTIWWAQERVHKYESTLRPYNYWALIINGAFVLLHYLQTVFFYDAIAQDIPSWTAQFTVIMMLFVILAMENRRRGLFFGRKLNFRAEFYEWIKRYHGYAFSFAVIYTFWFHPMVPTWGHLLGFVHVILVMAQGSLAKTRMHVNRKWTFLLEILVLPHAAFVAITQSYMLFFMFAFGFIMIFVVTQMHGLGLKQWQKRVFYVLFLGTVIFVYTLVRQPFQINEVIRIPAIEYGMIFVMYGLWWLFARPRKPQSAVETPSVSAAAGD